MDFKTEFKALIAASLNTGGDALDSLATYALERTTHLSTIVGEAGYEEAVLDEVDNVALMAGIRAVETGDGADARLRGIILGAMRIGAVAL